MATKTFTQLTAVTTLAAGDELVQWNASAAAARKITVANFIANSPNGGLAEKGVANAFTVGQSIAAGSTSVVGLILNAATSATANLLELKYNNILAIQIAVKATARNISLLENDHGASWGPNVNISRNNNASTPSAGFLYIENLSGTEYSIWPDASGNLRIHTDTPTNAKDVLGSVVGTQTSTLASKNILGDGVTPADALATILATPIKRFTYKSGAYNASEFHGIIADYSPEFAMDSGRAFSPVSAFGYTVQAIKALTERIIALEAR